MLNVCMVGHGMMGIWHSEALKGVEGCQLHTVVGRPKKPDAGGGRADRGPPARLDRAVRREVRLQEVEHRLPPGDRRPRGRHRDHRRAQRDARGDVAGRPGAGQARAGGDPDRDEPGGRRGRGGRGQGARADPRRGAPDALPGGAAARRGADPGRRGAGQPRAGPVLHPPAGQRRRHRAAAQLDRQPALAPHHAPDRLRAVGGRRGRPDRGRAADPEHPQRVPADRAAHRDPDGAGAGGRDARRPDHRLHRLVLLGRVHLRHPRGDRPGQLPHRRAHGHDHHRRGPAAGRLRAAERRADRARLRERGPRGPRARGARAGRCCRRCGCCTGCSPTGTPSTAPRSCPAAPSSDRPTTSRGEP